MKTEKDLLLDIKSQFGWPVDLYKYGLSEDNLYWDGHKTFNHLTKEINDRVDISTKKLLDAKNLCKALSYIPWVESIIVTGSVASNNAKPLDDIDIWLIVQERRLWLVRALDFFIYSILKRRRLASDGISDEKVNNKLCFNMYTTIEGTAFNSKNASFAIQFIDSIPIFMRRKTAYLDLVIKNAWIKEFFPSWYEKTIKGLRHIKLEKEFKKRSFMSFFIDILEYIAGVLMILKSKKKIVLKRSEIFVDMFTTWETERILTINAKKIITKRSEKS